MISYLFVLAVASVTGVVLATLAGGAFARMGFPLTCDEKRLGGIDGLRGYLALSVVIHHFVIWIQTTRLGGSWSAPPIYFLNQLGAGAVGMFFMTTGFVFYPRILRGFRSVSWTSVYISRAFRIVPLIVFSVLVITSIIIARTGTMPGWDYLWAAAKWISTWGEPPLIGYPDSGRLNAYVLWSLWYEWIFYLFILPLAAAAMDVARGRNLPSWSIPVGLFVVGLFVQIVSGLTGLPSGIFLYLPLFASGMLAHEIRSRSWAREILCLPAIGPLSAFCLLLGMTLTEVPYGISLPLFMFFFLCVAAGNRFGGLFKNRGALVIGECSYGIYLIHGTLLDIVFIDFTRLVNGINTTLLPLYFLPILLGIVIIAGVLFIVIERPAMKAGKVVARLATDRPFHSKQRDAAVAP